MATDRPASPLESDSTPSLGDDNRSTHSSSGSKRTQSITSSVYDYQFKDGRRYHAYEPGLYMLPNDDTEQDRLDLQHHIFRLSIDGPLHIAPIPKDYAGHVLDIGTGTGIWAMEFADDHPASTVLGVDLSPIQPDFVPANCSFRVDNIESDWIADEKFDFIHSRAMVGGIKSWPNLFSQAHAHLKPGGIIEVQDVYFPTVCNDPSQTSTSVFVAYNNLLLEATKRVGLDFQATTKWKTQLEAAGFVDVHTRWVNWPVGPWAKHKKNKIIGKFTYADFTGGLTMTRPFFQNVLGKSKEDVDELFEKVKVELEEQKIHLFQKVCFCWARKPRVDGEVVGGQEAEKGENERGEEKVVPKEEENV
ncbi:TAM domain methyltransferase [Microthyrium microscopicum]|uniref:TAM domain methyltransferase n=1 Tax=Microthyrium microscopicum TaxID=703497 RepID=A0A6A6UGF5_9PEZI|nr:TAM domain methyltransferase [Microthyrium microscopicum]